MSGQLLHVLQLLIRSVVMFGCSTKPGRTSTRICEGGRFPILWK